MKGEGTKTVVAPVCNMKLSSLCFLAAIAIQTPCYADVTKLSPEHRKVLQDSSGFREIHTTSNLPPGIVALCADGSGRLADPGKRWEATDVITDSKLPRKRLIWAVVSGEYYVVHYERGGRAHNFHILLATFKHGGNARDLWRGVGEQLKDFPAFIDALNGNTLDDRLEYAH
jgi:hypothetical protein